MRGIGEVQRVGLVQRHKLRATNASSNCDLDLRELRSSCSVPSWEGPHRELFHGGGWDAIVGGQVSELSGKYAAWGVLESATV